MASLPTCSALPRTCSSTTCGTLKEVVMGGSVGDYRTRWAFSRWTIKRTERFRILEPRWHQLGAITLLKLELSACSPTSHRQGRCWAQTRTDSATSGSTHSTNIWEMATRSLFG